MHTSIQSLKQLISSLIYDIGQGVPHRELHNTALELHVAVSKFEKAYEEYINGSGEPVITVKPDRYTDADVEEEIRKVARKLPKWANKQNQINSRILNLYLFLTEQYGRPISEDKLRQAYGNNSEFDRNYPQMKIIAPKNHAKVFDSNNGMVSIWPPVQGYVDSYIELQFEASKEKNLSLIKDAFTSVFGCEGSQFGSGLHGNFGFHEPNEGLQWNAYANTNRNAVYLGVNLEGMKYTDWPIARFLEHELSTGGFVDLKNNLEYPDLAVVFMARNAWQMAARPRIIEGLIGNKPYPLDSLNANTWREIVSEAYECLEPVNHRGRALQTVTMENTGEKREMQVSPHLTVATMLWKVAPNNLDAAIEIIKAKKDQLQPIYDYVVEI